MWGYAVAVTLENSTRFFPLLPCTKRAPAASSSEFMHRVGLDCVPVPVHRHRWGAPEATPSSRNHRAQLEISRTRGNIPENARTFPLQRESVKSGKEVGGAAGAVIQYFREKQANKKKQEGLHDLFFMSLAKDMENINDELHDDLKIELMQVMRKYKRSKYGQPLASNSDYASGDEGNGGQQRTAFATVAACSMDLSDSSSDEEEAMALLAVMGSPQFWVHPINRDRKQKGEFATTYQVLRKDATRFMGYFRMSVASFDHLLQEIEPMIAGAGTNFRESVSPEEKLMITIKYLATGDSFRTIATSFKVGFMLPENDEQCQQQQ
ncbi:unnamed protein product [Cyprideis torosa]|uniref:Uncharacterized protein n=1 Tax=Cyprideis torosa TaxID=163714 RepID=A0A7R8ZQ15_9CRUS|nr:unnamed protein product [Cyprideis torosa]CAG0891085.1 unnamed protein product [Cyprideis torosa]